jgi:hypothetical protein
MSRKFKEARPDLYEEDSSSAVVFHSDSPVPEGAFVNQ